MSLELKTWAVKDTATGIVTNREALVYSPVQKTNAPILFAFHGHGGTAKGFALKGFELLWPEAIVVYPQGLDTPTPSDPVGDKFGWQDSVGEISSETHVRDQDVKFFDAMLATFMPSIDPRLIFLHGYSNGGGLVYNVLWAFRGNQLAGLAVVAATVNKTDTKNPTPVIHIAGKKDPVVSFSWQQYSTEKVRTLNNCVPIGLPYYIALTEISSTKYWSFIRKPVVFGSYDGDHTYPDAAPKVIVKFFKRIAGGVRA